MIHGEGKVACNSHVASCRDTKRNNTSSSPQFFFRLFFFGWCSANARLFYLSADVSSSVFECSDSLSIPCPSGHAVRGLWKAVGRTNSRVAVCHACGRLHPWTARRWRGDSSEESEAVQVGWRDTALSVVYFSGAPVGQRAGDVFGRDHALTMHVHQFTIGDFTAGCTDTGVSTF